MTLRLAVPSTLVLAATALGFISCGGSKNSTPTTATSPTPAPAPAPTPAPTPVPEVIPGSNCALGLGVERPTCSRTSPDFLKDVDDAINKVVREHPQYFDLDNQLGGGGYLVKSVGGYVVGVVRNMELAGYCADWDGEELQVKDSNSSSDQYDILTANGFIRRGESSYRATCFPAAFPLAKGTPGQQPGCSLAGSRDLACGREDPSFLADVEAALDQLIKDKPDIFNTGDNQPGTNFIKVLNVKAYTDNMVELMSKKGYCARWDGEELQVKKENKYSDQYDILTAGDYTRRGEGAYRATCWPAAF